jgi:nicotinic acid mononucleotide adenylyltransferase
MCHAAFDGMGTTNTLVKVSDAERRSWQYCYAKRNNPNTHDDNDDGCKSDVTFSVGTGSLLEYLQTEYRNESYIFSFCVGADSFLDLMNGKWKEGRRVLELLENGRRLLVLHRVSNNHDDHGDPASVSPSTTEQYLKSQVDAAGAQLIQMDSVGSISSTQVRECRDMERLSTLIVPSVLEYIKRNKLYQFADS